MSVCEREREAHTLITEAQKLRGEKEIVVAKGKSKQASSSRIKFELLEYQQNTHTGSVMQLLLFLLQT